MAFDSRVHSMHEAPSASDQLPLPDLGLAVVGVWPDRRSACSARHSHICGKQETVGAAQGTAGAACLPEGAAI